MQQSHDRAGGVSSRQTLPQAQFFGSDDIDVHSCCGDARSCQSGDVFVALDDADCDGHADYDEALHRGAAAIVAEHLLPVSVPVCVVPDSRDAYGRICQQLADEPGETMHVVGVTGTNGKSTTSLLISSILEAARQPVGALTTLSRSDSIDTVSASRTTPAPPELASWLARMAMNGCSHAVVEVSSRGLAQRNVAGLNFDAAVLTNLRRDHLDLHGSVLNYRKTKARLFQQLKPHGFVVINVDDPASQFVLSQISSPVITVGQREPADITATVVERYASEQTFLLNAGNECVPVRTRMIGDHHVSNCLAAAATGIVMGIDLPTVARGLEAVDHVPGRLERLECGQPFGVFVDAADNADRLAVALKTLRKVTAGRVHCVFGPQPHRPANERPLMGRVIERAADVGVLTGNHFDAQPLQLIHDVLDGYDRPARAHVIPTRKQAILWALDQARPGDSLLIAGEGRSGFISQSTEQTNLDDFGIAQHWLYRTATAEPALIGIN